MGAMPGGWTLPEITPCNEAWFTSGSLAVQRCTECATRQHPPEEICHVCGSMTFDHVTLAPRGTVASYTVIHYAAHPALADVVPYTVVLVSLDGAPELRVVGDLEDGGDGAGVEIGMAVVPYWDERVADDGTVVRLPQWRRA